MSHSLVKCGFYRSLSRAVCAGTCAACVRMLVPRGRPRECVVEELFIAHHPSYRGGVCGWSGWCHTALWGCGGVANDAAIIADVLHSWPHHGRRCHVLGRGVWVNGCASMCWCVCCMSEVVGGAWRAVEVNPSVRGDAPRCGGRGCTQGHAAV